VGSRDHPPVVPLRQCLRASGLVLVGLPGQRPASVPEINGDMLLMRPDLFLISPASLHLAFRDSDRAEHANFASRPSAEAIVPDPFLLH
jgi:hypothetical protein